MADDSNVDWSGLQVLSVDDCRAHLTVGAVGRIGFVEEGGPVILPVNYTMDGHAVVFRTAAGSAALGMMQRPCASSRRLGHADHTGWSVLAKGVADEVLDEEEIARLEQLPVRPWSRPDLRDHWIRIMVEELTGRRIGPAD
jgi:nitroimidazol reductase NimA-like FMN-containing flavoprotein (pyridoxamine 5'-phosphate oxidase superfamily)